MYDVVIPSINASIQKNKKAIVSLGCSFVQGHGAINQAIYDNYSWSCDRDSPYTKWHVNENEKQQIIQTYPNVLLNPDNTLNFSIHEMENSFVYQLANQYFNGEYTPINLGQSGAGNRAAIKELYFYPDIMWDNLEEIIVIFCPSGAERFDFMSDQYDSLNNHNRWVCMWPNSDSVDTPRNTLWKGYKDFLHSKKFEILEQLAHIQELLLWCKCYRAKLIIVPSFQNIYNKTEFTLRLMNRIKFDGIKKIVEPQKNKKEIDSILNLWPWENMLYPENMKSWTDILTKRENTNKHFYEYYGTGSPNNWITPCAHPSVKGHNLLASILYQHILKM